MMLAALGKHRAGSCFSFDTASRVIAGCWLVLVCWKRIPKGGVVNFASKLDILKLTLCRNNQATEIDDKPISDQSIWCSGLYQISLAGLYRATARLGVAQCRSGAVLVHMLHPKIHTAQIPVLAQDTMR